MCGIVGVTGRDNAASFVLDGLKRLEYRGYDSAGLAVCGPDGGVRVAKAAGKVANLAALDAAGLTGRCAIGHTRWATHGAATDANAHPHQAGRVAIVHNGIIENYRVLRERVLEAGRNLASDTDTEIVAHLIDMALGQGLQPVEATQQVIGELEGAFALAVMFEDEPELLIGARRGAPLAAALGGGAGFLGSDLSALAGAAETVLYLEDGEFVVVRPGRLEVFDRAGTRVDRALKPAARELVVAEKGSYRHFMAKEIHEQPEVVSRTLTRYLDPRSGRVREDIPVNFAEVNRLLVVACGTAAYAGQVAGYWFEDIARLPARVEIASEFRYRNPAFQAGDIALFISQSGETADTLEALRLCKKAGVKTLALVNTPGSTMAREADIVLETLAGPEIGVASTKAFTCQLAALASLCLLAANQRGSADAQSEAERVASLLSVPGAMTRLLASEARIESLAHEIMRRDFILLLGRGPLYPLALEAALKLKEISYINTEGYAAGELKHGPIALIEEGVPVIVIAPDDALFEKNRSSMQQVASRGARVIVMTDARGAEHLRDDGFEVLIAPDTNALTAPIILAVAIQLLAYHVAVARGTDVDQPRNLAKSVTVE